MHRKTGKHLQVLITSFQEKKLKKKNKICAFV